MPKRYSEGLPHFFANSIESIESHLDAFWCYMESLGVEHQDVYMRALGESLGGNVNFWLYMLALGSIIGYDMFIDLLREEWGKHIDESIQSDNDGVVEEQSDKDEKDNHYEITDDFPHQIGSSSPEPTMNTPLNDHSIQENYNEEILTLQDYDIDVEGEHNDHY